MGAALLQKWLLSFPDAEFTVIDPHISSDAFSDIERFTSPKDAAEQINSANLIILATKPQIMAKVCEELAPLISSSATILSIAAGQPIASFTRIFGEMTPVIRVMPNTPAAIGKGMSAAMANPFVSSECKEFADALLKETGAVEWIKDEYLFDAVTAVSGSGPAYVFFLIEAMAMAGEKAGLDAAISKKLARQTVIGAAALCEAESTTPPETLRQNVTSPGGTTAAALEVLMNGEFQDTLNRALIAAKDRSIELGK